MKRNTSVLSTLCVAAGLLAITTAPVRAGIIFTMEEVGSDIVVTSTGSLTNPFAANNALPDGTPTNVPAVPEITPPIGVVGFGADSIGTVNYDNAIVSGPSSFGTSAGSFLGTGTPADESFLGLGVLSDDFFTSTTPLTSGTPLGVGTGATFGSTSLAAIGINPGTYTWTLDARFNNETFTIVVLEPSTVPAPGAAALILPGVVGLGLLRRRRQRLSSGA